MQSKPEEILVNKIEKIKNYTPVEKDELYKTINT